MTEFRTKPGRLLPGSMTIHGNVIDHAGNSHAYGPCFIPSDISAARMRVLGMAGWALCASDPSLDIMRIAFLPGRAYLSWASRLDEQN